MPHTGTPVQSKTDGAVSISSGRSKMQRHREAASDRLWKEKVGSNVSLVEVVALLFFVALAAVFSMAG
jgi:hypothetical protein